MASSAGSIGIVLLALRQHILWLLWLVLTMVIAPFSAAVSLASGPLHPSPANPRYFADGSGRILILVGSHTWVNFQDAGTTDPPPRFDYDRYLDFLRDNNHNFFRLWVWEQAKWLVNEKEAVWFAPQPYLRTGPGLALDGKPKYDLTKFDDRYFARMR